MRFPLVLTILSALLGLLLVFVVGTYLLQPPQALILSAGFDSEVISPNADQDNDITIFRYEISRNARVSILLTGEDGIVHYFRNQEERSPQSYSVAFSGVVDGYVQADESLVLTLDDDPDGMMIERRLLPDGVYSWQIIAENETEHEDSSGTLTIQSGDSALPIITTFTMSSNTFTPNRDGVTDRVVMNVFLEKDADLRVFLLTDEGVELPISQRIEDSCRPEDECGRYTYDYEGGVDLGQTPPPDGSYRVVVLAQDAVGQRIRRESTLTIVRGGVPRAEISPQARDADVFWVAQPYESRFFSDINGLGDLLEMPEVPQIVGQNLLDVPNGDMLIFRLTVNNYSDVPIRTTNPPVGTVYEQTQLASSLGTLEEAGAWRVGIQCDTSLTSFPYRWAIGEAQDLISIVDESTGREYRYLPAHTSTVVWGAIRLTEINPFANPQTCWAGLIHEGVNVSVENSFVGPLEIHIGEPPESGTDSE